MKIREGVDITPDDGLLLNAMAMQVVESQWPPGKVPHINMDPPRWTIASDSAQVRAVKLEHDCQQCRDGIATAVQFLRRHPDRVVALANLTYSLVDRRQ